MNQLNLSNLSNKNILLGVSGSIAAYKSAELLRLYQKNGAQTRVIMTQQATEFITPLTMQALSGNEVHIDLVDYAEESAMGHIELSRWADVLVIAPASASLLARLASGAASDLLSAVFLATTAPRVIAPAMNKEMWAKGITQQNIKQLKKFKNTYIAQPGDGWQACGEIGQGRLEDPDEIAGQTAALFSRNELAGARIVVTAGPTREPLDKARYISNYSSGKMGYAVARAAMEAGAEVTLISGPVALDSPPNCRLIQVESARQMMSAAEKIAPDTDILIATAAVADWRPASQSQSKIAKELIPAALKLVVNPDILANMRTLMPPKSLAIGFAAESAASSSALKKKGKDKLKKKGADMICVNVLDKAFGSDENEILLLFADGKSKQLPQMVKSAAARILMQEITVMKNNRETEKPGKSKNRKSKNDREE